MRGRVTVARYVAVGGPMHGHLLDDTGEEVTLKGQLYRRVEHPRVERGAVWVWEGLDPDEAKLLISEWTR